MAGCRTTRPVDLGDVDGKLRIEKAYAVLKQEPIPVPATSPFGGDEPKEAAYLDGLRRGWDFAISGDILFGLRLPPADLPKGVASAWIEGWKLGTSLGGDKLISQLQKTP